MSIQTVEKGKKYRFRERVGKDPLTGKYIWESKTFKGGEQAARIEHAKWVGELHTTIHRVTESGTVRDALDFYIERQQRRDLSASYIHHDKKRVLDLKVGIGDILLKDLTNEHIERFYYKLQTDRDLSAMSIQHYHATLTSALNIAVKQHWIFTNPATDVIRPKVRKKSIYIPSVEEVTALLAAAQREHPFNVFAYIYISASTWARRGELLALQWDDIDFKNSTITLNKTVTLNADRRPELNEYLKTTGNSRKGDRTLDVSEDPGTIAVLLDYKAWQLEQARLFDVSLVDNAFLFSSTVDGSQPRHPNSMTKLFGVVRDDAFNGGNRSKGKRGERMSLHCLRHYGVTQALSNGLSIAEVSYRAGHTNITTTMNTYGHYIPGRDRNAGRLMGALLSYTKALPPGDDKG